METGALYDLDGKNEAVDYDSTVGPELRGDPWLALESQSEAGKSLCLIDKTGRRLFVDIPVSKLVDSRKHPAGPELCGDPWLALESQSEAGKSLCLIDKTGRRLLGDNLVSKLVDSSNHPAVRILMPRATSICPICKCQRVYIDGDFMYINPTTWEICTHPCNH